MSITSIRGIRLNRNTLVKSVEVRCDIREIWNLVYGKREIRVCFFKNKDIDGNGAS